MKLRRGNACRANAGGHWVLMVFLPRRPLGAAGMVEWLLTTMLPYLAITLIILFQRKFDALYRGLGATFVDEFASRNPKDSHDDIVMAAEYFRKTALARSWWSNDRLGCEPISRAVFLLMPSFPTTCCFPFSGPDLRCTTAP